MLVQLGTADQVGNSFQIFKDGQSLHFSFADATGNGGDATAAMDNWQPGEKHLVTTSWGQPGPDGESQVSFYVDGQLAGEQTYKQFQLGSDSVLRIGQNAQNGPSVPGQVNNFSIYNHALAPEQMGTAPAPAAAPSK